MSGSAPGSADRALFFGRSSTIRRKSTAGLVVVALAATILLGRWQLALRADARGPVPTAPAPASVRVVPVAEEVVVAGLRYSAVVKELQKAELSFRVAGNVDHVHRVPGAGGSPRNLHEGDRVPQGTVLAQLDEADYRRERAMAAERLATAEAKTEQARADAEHARIEFRRDETLVQRNAMSASELDSARAKWHNTRAAEAAARREVETARLNLQQAEANLSYCSLVAPFEASTIAARYVEPDERVAANQRAFLVLDLSSVVIAFGVPDTLVGRLEIGRPVEVTTDALPGERFGGVVHKIGTMADAQTRTYLVEVRVDEPRGLRPGMVATAHFRREARARLLPLTAIAPGATPGREFVAYKVVDEGGRPVARAVPVVLEDVLDNRVAVRLGDPDGLRDGDRVVATGIHRLHDGEAVAVVGARE